MRKQQAEALSLIVRQTRDFAKDSIDTFAELAQKALAVLAEDGEESGKPVFNKSENEKFVSRKKLAKILNVSLRTISKLQAEGMPSLYIGRSVRFDVDKAVDFIDRKQKGRGKLRVVS